MPDVGPPPMSDPQGTSPDEDGVDEDDSPQGTIRALGSSSGQVKEPGEPLEEITPASFIQPIPASRPNKDSKRVARYLAGQATWSSNHLLLTQHPDALPIDQYRLVVRTLLDELGRPGIKEDLGLGLVGLLLQALTDRSPGRLTSVKLQGSPRHARKPADYTLQGCLQLDVVWRMRVDGRLQGGRVLRT